MKKETHFHQGPGYLERNMRWIKPAVGGLMLATTPMLVHVIDPVLFTETPLLPWLTVVGLFLCMLSLGFGLYLTDTISARIVTSGILFLLCFAVIEVLASLLPPSAARSFALVIVACCVVFNFMAWRRR